ncbi:CGNR zinc finger domain-containing protein [Trebonia kvetii]|uniref:CGNR zinc finger domain-containing protein n=1 Tax=Trebonia kvetii TaxID=2480626 RepID=A0A6P2BVK9_9ACTN|nr:CGNR zinc finger domain-containing protein [Trebonia kvetii]TVZ03169.1 CGNR zinc finger domain-containing protein [Trebonia kvetii]
MLFDSHIELLLEAAVSLVNELTDGERQGRPYAAPAGEELLTAAAAALPVRAQARVPERLPGESAAYLFRAAQVMRGVFEAMAADRPDDAAAAVNRLLRDTGARPQLDRVDGEPWQVHFHGSSDTYGVGWSAGCATALALAVGSELAGRLGVCGAPHCDRVYVDASRNSARRFCSAPCQSRVKAAVFRARRGVRSGEKT